MFFIILCFLIGCTNIDVRSKSTDDQKLELRIERKYKTGANNFVYLIKEITPEMEECAIVPELCFPVPAATASGIVFSSDDASIFVLTAAHFCVDDPEEIPFAYTGRIVGIASDVPRTLFPIKIDEKSDLCMLMGVKNKKEKFKNIKIAKKLTIGEEIYTVAAPLGIGGPGFRLIFEGLLSGCNQNQCMVTTEAAPGSSGAAILNESNEIISIVMAVPQDFSSVVLAPSNIDLWNFILELDKEVDIYPYIR